MAAWNIVVGEVVLAFNSQDMCKAGGIRFEVTFHDGIGSELGSQRMADVTNQVRTSNQGCQVAGLDKSRPTLQV